MNFRKIPKRRAHEVPRSSKEAPGEDEAEAPRAVDSEGNLGNPRSPESARQVAKKKGICFCLKKPDMVAPPLAIDLLALLGGAVAQ